MKLTVSIDVNVNLAIFQLQWKEQVNVFAGIDAICPQNGSIMFPNEIFYIFFREIWELNSQLQIILMMTLKCIRIVDCFLNDLLKF